MTSDRRALAALLAAASLVAGCSLGGPTTPAEPEVRGNANGFFMWAVGEPTLALGPIDPGAARDHVDAALALSDEDGDTAFPITIVAVFGSADEAEDGAAEIRTILEDGARWYADPANAADREALDDPARLAPMIPPDAAAMKRHLLAAGTRGVGWGGEPGQSETAVYSLGPLLFVTGLESDAIEIDDPPLHPLAHLLAAGGADVMLEGDRYGEGSIVLDVSCRIPDPIGGVMLRDDIGDAAELATYHVRPPWIDPPLSDQERLARATFRRWTAGMAAAMDDPAMVDLAMKIANATGEDERAAAMQAFQKAIVERGQTKVEGELDPETMALLLAGPELPNDDATDAKWRRDLGERMGRLPVVATKFGDLPAWDDQQREVWSANARIVGDRLELGYLSFGRAAAGLPYLAAYLTDHGCDDIRLKLIDYDTIRVD